jgi:hypothetical protein
MPPLLSSRDKRNDDRILFRGDDLGSYPATELDLLWFLFYTIDWTRFINPSELRPGAVPARHILPKPQRSSQIKHVYFLASNSSSIDDDNTNINPPITSQLFVWTHHHTPLLIFDGFEFSTFEY